MTCQVCVTKVQDDRASNVPTKPDPQLTVHQWHTLRVLQGHTPAMLAEFGLQFAGVQHGPASQDVQHLRCYCWHWQSSSIKLCDCLLIQQQHQVKLTGSLTSIAGNGLGGESSFLLEEEEKEEEEFL